MKQYVDLLKKILKEGEVRGDRTGTGTLSIFGGQLEFDLTKSFPIVTIKKTLYKSAFTEMLWFISGATNTKFLKERNIPIWDAWADENGNLGPIYGYQWRNWHGKIHAIPQSKLLESPPDFAVFENKIGQAIHRDDNGDPVFLFQEKVDQLKELIRLIKTQPEGRRHIVTAWNPAFIKEMGLPPCHRDFQCYVSGDGHLDLMMAIRSWDTCLGGPFNIAQYGLLTHLIARATDLKPRRLIINYGDAHIYANHVEPIKEHLEQYEPINCSPQLVFKTDNTDIDGYKPEDFEIVGYESNPMLKLPIAV